MDTVRQAALIMHMGEHVLKEGGKPTQLYAALPFALAPRLVGD
jgi:hypothetical protein